MFPAVSKSPFLLILAKFIVFFFIFADILNQLFISYTPLSQTHSDVKKVQSLIPIWEVYFVFVLDFCFIVVIMLEIPEKSRLFLFRKNLKELEYRVL